MRDVSKQRSYRSGLRRLWLVVSVLWLLGVIAMQYDGGRLVLDIFRIGLLPIAALYLLGVAIAWMIDGFSNR